MMSRLSRWYILHKGISIPEEVGLSLSVDLEWEHSVKAGVSEFGIWVVRCVDAGQYAYDVSGFFSRNLVG